MRVNEASYDEDSQPITKFVTERTLKRATRGLHLQTEHWAQEWQDDPPKDFKAAYGKQLLVKRVGSMWYIWSFEDKGSVLYALVTKIGVKFKAIKGSNPVTLTKMLKSITFEIVGEPSKV